ncbi:MAG TPA: carboxypeptidase regulatory-like domain-containing protein [Thermoanaerobaculia bacterium]|nr:carboxypeptidase regulatory-like domain-containing protein [Thermoanaerobaculia bacterium]
MRKPALLAASAALASIGTLAAPAPPTSGELAGRIVLLDAQGNTSPAMDAVVWLPGIAERNPHFAPARSITQREKRFEPHVLAVRRGTVVSFPNLDRIFHNVFSLTPGNQFDLGLYRGGASREARFETPGLVRVYCNIHPQMAANVFVVDGGAFAMTDADGRYRIGGVPPGPHVARVWQERGGGKEERVEVRGGETATLDVRLDASGWRERPHKNKHGQDYPPVASDADRY